MFYPKSKQWKPEKTVWNGHLQDIRSSKFSLSKYLNPEKGNGKGKKEK